MHVELINLISLVGKKLRRNMPRPCSSNASTQIQRHLEVTERRMLRNRKKKCLTPASAMLQPMQRCRKITEILDFVPGYKVSYSLQPFSNRAFNFSSFVVAFTTAIAFRFPSRLSLHEF